MKYPIYLLFYLVVIGCSTKKEPLVLKTTSEALSIQDGDEFHKSIWNISPDVDLDEFVVRKFKGDKKVRFISDIDTLTFNVVPNKTYDFVVEFNKEKAFTRINTDTLKEASLPPVLSFYYDNNDHMSLTDTLTFTMGSNHGIHLKGRINNSDPIDLLFDTGANAIVIESDVINSVVNLTLDGKTENEGSDGSQTILTSSFNKLEIENLNWENVELLSIDYKNPKFDGVLGWIAFEGKILEIDYDKHLLVIHQSKKTIPLAYVKVDTRMIGGLPYLKGKVTVNGKESIGWFEYDSGSNGSLRLSQKFASENSLNNVMKVVGTSSSSGSAGISWTSKNFILPKLTLGKFEIGEVPIIIADKDPAGIDHNDILGNNLLKRFNAIIDLQNFEIYLKPNSLLNTEF